MMFNQPHELTQGAIAYDAAIAPDTPWLFETMAGDSSFGSAPPILEVVQSLLTDGEYVRVVSHGNREVQFRLRVSAPDGKLLAQADALLMAEKSALRPAPLVWTPPSGDAWPCVYDVVHMDVRQDFSDEWDREEVMRHYRYYLVTWTCLPWVRDLETTVIPAIAEPDNPDDPVVYEVIDNCGSATGWLSTRCHAAHWTGYPPITTGTDSGNSYIRASSNITSGTGLASMGVVRPGAVALSGFPYLTVDALLLGDYDNRPTLLVIINGVTYRPTAVVPVTSGGPVRERYYFTVPDSFTTLYIHGEWPLAYTGGPSRQAYIFEIGRTDRLEIGVNGFQLSRTATIGGSAPTDAAITFDAGSSPLMDSTALIYTGASPVVPLRALCTTSATVTPDDTKISGGTNDLSGPMVFLVPVSRVSYSTYSLPVRLNSTGSDVVAWSAKIVDSAGADIPGSDVVVSGETLVVNDTADPWMIHVLAQIQLPVVRIEGDSTHAVQLTLSMATGGTDVLVDEGWLCDTDKGAVTIIHEPTAFQLSKIELRSPQLDALDRSAYGTWVDHGTQNITRLATALGAHFLKPGLIYVFTATDKAKYAGCSLEFYRRYLNYAGPDLPVESDVA